MEISKISIVGWLAIVAIATLIFIVLMVRGISLSLGDKSVVIGKKLEDKIETFKKEIEIENIKRAHDERLQKMLFKKSIKIDNYLNAQMMKNVKKMDGEIYNIFAPFVHCQFPSLTILDIFEDVLMERVYFNNMKEKLTGSSQKNYLQSIVDDIKNNYSIFYLQLKRLHCGESYPEWELIEENVKVLIRNWAHKCIGFYIDNVNEKIKMYQKYAKRFETEEFKKMAIKFPYKKNKCYLENLNNALISL